jgi:RHS repeat-associated protein
MQLTNFHFYNPKNYLYSKPVKGLRGYEVGYGFSFNGKENDDETQTQDYGMRIYDYRLGKFLSVDPLTKDYPFLTPYQFASNIPIRYIDLDGLEAGDPMYYMLEGFRQYFDAGANLFTIDFNLNLNYTREYTPVSKTVTTNSTEVSYLGWDLFKPGAYPKGAASVSTMPAPKVVAKNTTKVENVNTVSCQVGTATATTKKVASSDGTTTTTKTVSNTVVSNTGVPVTGSASSSTTNTGTNTLTGKVEIGPPNFNFYFQSQKTTSDGKSTQTASGGVQVNAQTPSVGGNSVGFETSLQFNVKIK